MMKFLALAILFVGTRACSDSYPTPSGGGHYCTDLAGISDGENCWGDCVDGCPTIRCQPGQTCFMETRPVSAQGDCIWPLNTKLCCAHITGGDAKVPKWGLVVDDKNKTKVDLSQVHPGVVNTNVNTINAK